MTHPLKVSLPLTFMTLLILLCLSPRISCGAGLTAADQALFPDDIISGLPKPDGAVITLHFSKGGSVELTPVRFRPAPGKAESGNEFWCGVILRTQDHPSQEVVTIGTGSSETVSCVGRAAIGSMPPQDKSLRIGMIYKVNSPNAASVIPVILVQNSDNEQWHVDDSLSDKLSQTLPGKITLEKMRRYLVAE